MNRKTIGISLMLCVGMIAGCATTDHKASVQQKPIDNPSGSRGVIYLTMYGSQWSEPQAIKPTLAPQKLAPKSYKTKKKAVNTKQITFVKVKNGRGRTIGEYILPIYFGDLIIDSLKEELVAAGYAVNFVRKLPDKAGKGIDISWISTEMEQDTGLLTYEGSCDLQIRLDIWQNGSKFSSHDYEAAVSDYTYKDKDLLLSQLVMKAKQSIMRQAIPEILHELSGTHN